MASAGVSTKKKSKPRPPQPSLPVYAGPFGREQAERLLWRAGLGPRRGETDQVAGLGLDGAIQYLTQPPPLQLMGPEPVNDSGAPISPTTVWGDEHNWWLDRMARTNQPLIERMTLVWHDWFATGRPGVGATPMLGQYALFQRNALGSFFDLLLGVTVDPAMLLWLNGDRNMVGKPNENYARELMELFTLGADRGAYSEKDIREQARALTGWTHDPADPVLGPTNFRFDPRRHDYGKKTVFGKSGNFDWRDSCRLVVEHPLHASFVVGKLWSYFVPTPPSPGTSSALQSLYTQSGYQIRPLVEAILRHPDFYAAPRLVKPPAVLTAGMLRVLNRGVDTNWAPTASMAGQRLFSPPGVQGWDDANWLDTSTIRGRWITIQTAIKPFAVNPAAPTQMPSRDADALVASALDFWDDPTISSTSLAVLRDFAVGGLAAANAGWKQARYPVNILNALRHLVAFTPEYQTA